MAGLAAGAALCAGGVAAAMWGADAQVVQPIELGEASVDVRNDPPQRPEEAQQGSEPARSRSVVAGQAGPSRSRLSRGQAVPPSVVVPSSSASGSGSEPGNTSPPEGTSPARVPSGSAITVRVVEPLLFQSFGARLDDSRVQLVSTSSLGQVQSPTAADHEPLVGEPFDVLFDAPSAGVHRVEISDPRFDPYVSKPVEPGERVDVRLVGSASLVLNVEAPGGFYPTDLEVTLTHKEIRSTISSYVATLNGGMIDDVVPWSYRLTARALEGTATMDVDDLEARECRVVSLQLAPRALVKGGVRHPGGQPAVGALVRLVRFHGEHRPGAQVAEVGEFWSVTPNREAVVEVVTGAHGEFALQAEDEGRYVVIAGHAGAPQVESAPLDLVRSEVVDVLDLTLPRGGRVAGRIAAVAGQELRGSKVLVFDPEGKSSRPAFPQPLEVGPDGRFQLGPLPAGKVSIYWYEAGHTSFGADLSGRPMGGKFLGEV